MTVKELLERLDYYDKQSKVLTVDKDNEPTEICIEYDEENNVIIIY